MEEFKKKVHTVSNYIDKLNASAKVLAHSLARLEQAYEIFQKNPNISLEEYLEIMEIEE